MLKRFILLFFAGLTALCTAFGQDSAIKTLKAELDRNFAILKTQPVPAYYISVRLDEAYNIGCTARLGRLQTGMQAESPVHGLSTFMRVGDNNLDNTHQIRTDGSGSYRNVQLGAEYVPIDNNPRSLRNALWMQLDELYKQNVQIYEQIKANIAVKVEQEDKSPDFSEEKAEQYYEKPLSISDFNIDANLWEEKVRKYSAVFDKNSDILDGLAYLVATVARETFIDTEGREIAQNDVSFHLALTAEARADDGMSLPLTKTWLAFTPEELPSDEEVIAAAEELSNMLSALKKAPVVESFTGPAILSPEATGVFFHEIFGHRVEGARLKQESDAQTFKKKIGESVLPKQISVIFDPTQRYFGKTALGGYYVFDSEGIRGQKVECVKNGVLKNFLMSRTPIEGFLHSNGHGRGSLGVAPVSRQSNLIVESDKKLKKDELFKRLRKEARSQGKEYAYYFKEVSGGFTFTDRFTPNSFNVSPLVVYRIYTDGRPDELVRGVDLVGTPLSMFSQIDACGDEYAVFNGACGAESGSVPVSCVAPSILVKRIETQKSPKNQSLSPILPKPAHEAAQSAKTKNEIIASAIRNETERALNGLKKDGLQSPFFISYSLGDIDRISITATDGSLISSERDQLRTGGSRLLMGDYACTDENFVGDATSSHEGFDGTPCIDDDETGIRYTVWRDLDAIYKSAAETYEQKLSAIKQLNIPAKDLELPDWDKTPVFVKNDFPTPEVNMNKSAYEEYVKAASAVFNDYPRIIRSVVNLNIVNSDNYFYNTEKSEFHLPIVVTSISAGATAKTDEGEDISSGFSEAFGNPSELPAIEGVKEKCRELADKLMEKVDAPKLNEAYSGPVLFEGVASVPVFYGGFFYGNHSLIARRKPLTSSGLSYGGNRLEEMIDKRITARELTVEDLTGTREYKGVKLLGYAPVDAQGVVPPAKLTLVENGILKTLLSDRIPTPQVPHSNGHALLSPGGGGSEPLPGVVRFSDTRVKSKDELRKELFAKAKEEGYDYAYIVRDSEGGGTVPAELYRVDIASGKETRIRSAMISNIDDDVFRKIVAVSDTEMIRNERIGSVVTFILPDAVLFSDLRIQTDRIDNFRKPPVVGR
ncbi:MAG: hypothetical protein LBR13_02355 [Dysgonamonadaceae bacterium]|jgi:predicted Zn-dependent protease|nr:hypothetical protein [Dysgonamonadaceae bacterium]